MNKANIKRFIDNKILKELSTGTSIADVRQKLLDNCNKYQKTIGHEKLDEPEIEKITDVRDKYLSYYVFYATKRIVDLYRVEIWDLYGWSQTKKFKAMIFKDKLRDNALPF